MSSLFNPNFSDCQEKYIKAKEKIEKDNIEYFQNRPPIFEGDPHELLDRLFVLVNKGSKGSVAWKHECREDIKILVEKIAKERSICMGDF